MHPHYEQYFKYNFLYCRRSSEALFVDLPRRFSIFDAETPSISLHSMKSEKVLNRSKRDKLDSIDGFDLRHRNPRQLHRVSDSHNSLTSTDGITSHNTLGNIISNFVRGKNDKILPINNKKQLVCFTQNFGDDLSKNILSAIKFNDLINDSSDWIVRNNRNTDHILSNKNVLMQQRRDRSNLSKNRKNLKGWLNVHKSDIAVLAKNLNKDFHKDITIRSTLPTSLLPPMIDAKHRSDTNIHNVGSISKSKKNVNSVNSIDLDTKRSFDINRLITPPVKVQTINMFHHISPQIQRNRFKPITVKTRKGEEKLFNPEQENKSLIQHLGEYQHQQNLRLNQQRKIISSSKHNSDANPKSLHGRTQVLQSRRLDTSQNASPTKNAEDIVNSLIESPTNHKTIQELLFPNKIVNLQVQKARKIFQRNFKTIRNNPVRIQTYE